MSVAESILLEGESSAGNARTSGGGLHVVHGVLSLDLGGLERLVVDLVKMGQKRGHRVSVVCIERPGMLARAVEEMGAEVFCLEKPAGRSAATVERAEALLRRLQPDVVHTHQIGALYYLGRAARRWGVGGRESGDGSRGIAVLHTEHSDHVAHAKTWRGKLRTRWLWRQTSRWAGKFCCVSEDIAASARRWGTVPAGKVEVVLNGIDVEKYRRTRDSGQWSVVSGQRTGDRGQGTSDCGLQIADCGLGAERARVRAELGVAADAVVIGTVGRLVEVKRQDLLVQAFAKIRGQGTGDRGRGSGVGSRQSGVGREMRLLIVGDGPERGRLEELAQRLGVREQVVFAGYQANPERFYRAMDVFALSSRHEGLPLALLEAWAAGVPVVAPNVGGIAKVVRSGETGLLFPREDEGALVEALVQVLSDEATAGRMAAAGRRIVEERYSLTRMVDEYERHYRELIAAV